MLSERLLFCTGSLVPEQGIDALVEALPLLLRRHPVRLVVDGEGPHDSHLQQRAAALGVADRVQFVGRLDADGLASLYRQADVAVVPSADEPSALAALAAMAAGVPLVASDAVALTGLLRHEETGLKAIPGSRLSLAEQIDRMLLDRPLARRLAEAAQREALIREEVSGSGAAADEEGE